MRFASFFALVLTCIVCLEGRSSAQQPNIIFFFVDDLGYGDLGCFWQDNGSTASKKFDTPAIDRMAAEGLKLTHHYISASVCAPSRGSLLTGRHQGHCEIRNSQFDKALPENHTIGSVLQQAGYYTALIGKAGLSGGEGSVNLSGTGSQNLAANPLHQGFDRFFGYHFHGDGHEHYPRNGTTDKRAFIYDDFQQVTNASLDLYTTDAWTAAAKDVIITEATDGDSQPFFIYLAYDTPHFKMQRPAVAYPTIDTDGNPLTGGIQWTMATDSNGRVRYASTANGAGVIDAYTHPDIPSSWTSSEKRHVGMIRRIDSSIADIIQTLKDLGIDDNTFLVFSSDNGPHNEGNNPRTFESFANMEGIKRDMWEAGIRVPTVVRWPGGITQATGDENNILENGYPSAIWDWMPTFADLADVPAPAWCDGVSLVPTLTGSGTQRDKGYLYFEFQSGGSTPNWTEFPNHGGQTKGQMQCLRIGNYMGVRTGITSGTEDFEIYDVTVDPGQANDLVATLPDLQAQMQALAITSRRPGAGVSRPYDSINLSNLPGFSSSPGVNWKSYAGPFPWVPEYRDLIPANSGTAATFDAATHAPANNSGILYEGYLNVPAAGQYTFYLQTDNGGHLFIHDAHVIDNDYHHDGSEVSGQVRLAAGIHPYRLYYRHGSAGHTLSLQWSGPNITKQAIPTTSLFTDTPTVTPGPPVAVDDTATTSQGQAVSIDVLANDFDDGTPGPLELVSVSGASSGTTSKNGNLVDYVPNAGFTGTDTFNYIITDGAQTDQGSVIVTVAAAFQAEDAFFSNGTISSAGSGWNGTGYVDLNEGAYVEWTINLATADTYDLAFTTTGAADGMAGQITVNSVVVGTLNFSNRGSWNSNWEVTTLPGVQLNAGNNTIRLTDSGNNQPQVDQLELVGDADNPIIVQPASQAAFPGENLSFTCSFLSDSAPTVEWLRNELSIGAGSLVNDGDNQYTATFFVNSVDAGDEGDYVCRIDHSGGTTSSAAAMLLVKELRVHWKFEGDFTDNLGNYDLTALQLATAPGFVAGLDGQALSCSGVDDGSALPGLTSTSPLGLNWFAGWSVSLWTQADNIDENAFSGIFHMNPGFQLDTDGTGNFRYRDTASTILGAITPQTWVMLTAVWDGSNTALYLNALLAETDADDWPLIDRFGVCVNRGLNNFYQGRVDEVMVWNYPLNQADIAQIFFDTTGQTVCVPGISPAMDIAGPAGSVPDCIVNLFDMLYFASQWLDCRLTPPSACN